MYALRPTPVQPEDSNVMSLRDHLLAAQQAASTGVELQHTPTHESHHIDPQIAPSPFSAGPITPGMEPQNPEVRKGRRELSTSKRAAQNRAAQRAFRQRKEQYIQSLKSQVTNYEQMATGYKNLENENLVLREYIITLQSRLLESGHHELPPAPVDLSRPSQRVTAAAAAAAAAAAEQSQENLSVEAQLQAAAAAAAQQATEIGHSAQDDDDSVDKADGDQPGNTTDSSVS